MNRRTHVPVRGLLLASLASALLVLGACPSTHYRVTLDASAYEITEGSVAEILLSATYRGGLPDAYAWRQVSGPKVELKPWGASQARAGVRGIEIAADTQLVFEIAARWGSKQKSARVAIVFAPADVVPALGANVQIGGVTTVAALADIGGATWTFYNVSNRLNATPVGTSAGQVHTLVLPSRIRDLKVVPWGPARYVLAAMGSGGIAVVNATDPAAMVLVSTVPVNYSQSGIAWADGGGNISLDNTISSVTAPIVGLETDGATLWLADEAFGLHRTSLANLLVGPVLEADGTLLIELDRYTLQYAGENPWGGPESITRVGSLLYVAQGFLGLGIYDATTLDRVGGYNHYTNVGVVEDWFGAMDVSTQVQPGYLDPATGMPDYRQASYEILQVWHGGVTAPTPWADFDRYGKYYYNCHDVAVATFGARTFAYLAYGLAGLVAVEVSNPSGTLAVTYQGYAPAVPAHGPEEPIGSQSKSLFPYYGAGGLKEAGAHVVDVRGTTVYYTEHFAGLVLLEGADDPALNWHGPLGTYDNDTNGTPGDHYPAEEFVTSYDMAPANAADEESLPAWMYEPPCLLATGEVGGHGVTVLLMPAMQTGTAGNVDLLLGAGDGGLSFIDIVNLTAPVVTDRYASLVYLPTTNFLGAAPDGTPVQTISIGHTEGVAGSDRYLYVGDGPHGLMVFKIVDAGGYMTDQLTLAANSLQGETAVDAGGTTIYPTPHARTVLYDPAARAAMVLCDIAGLRRVPVGAVEDGATGPVLVAPGAADIFEHNREDLTVPGLTGQDHAFDVAIRGTYAFVADGRGGLTVYDLSKDPTSVASGFCVGNLGSEHDRPALGRATGVVLWDHPSNGRRYAFVAGGPAGLGVVDVTAPNLMKLVKIFEPIKAAEEEGSPAGAADGRCVDVEVIGDHVFITYDSFGVLCYAIADLIAPLPAGVDPTEIWARGGGFDYRPAAVGHFKLQVVPGYETLDGGALNMTWTDLRGRRTLWVAYGTAGLVRIDWSNPAAPALGGLFATVGECTSVANVNGRLYVADGSGGLAIFK